MASVSVAIGDVPMGGMKQAENGDAKVLFVRDAGGIRAFQAGCPHYGAPLAKGAICGTKLYCPWHKAVFDIGDGGLIEPPALEGLKRYPVRIEGDIAIATFEPMPTKSPPRKMDDKHVVIVGTGASAVSAATTLRREGFGGQITMVGREAGEPYDRPKLSKNFLAKKTDPSAMILEKAFYADHVIDAVIDAAVKIEPGSRSVTLASGRTIVADALMIATGSRAVMPEIVGNTLANVFTLRSLADAIAISAAVENAKTIAVIGSGFIGLEAAAFLTKRGLKATVISPEPLPLAKRFGDDVGRAIKAYHEGNGIGFIEAKVKAFVGDGAVDAVMLEDGRTIEADLVLVGAGARPETDLITGVGRRDDGGIEIDDRLRVTSDVWLAGDIAAFSEARSGTTARIEHWRLAEQHGAHIAKAILGAQAPFRAAPFFWSNQGDKRLDYAGYAPDWDRIVVDGDIAALDFIAYYIKDDKALAACAIGHNPEMISFLHRLDEEGAPFGHALGVDDRAAV